MTFLSFLSRTHFLVSVVLDSAVFCLAFLAYRRTKIAAFVFLICASLISVTLAVGSHLHILSSVADALSFGEWSRVAYFASTVLWGIGIIQLIQYVRRDFERKTPPNTALEPTATVPSVPDMSDNREVSDSSTSTSDGRGSALAR